MREEFYKCAKVNIEGRRSHDKKSTIVKILAKNVVQKAIDKATCPQKTY